MDLKYVTDTELRALKLCKNSNVLKKGGISLERIACRLQVSFWVHRQ